ncbi:hypothetical protein FGB62_15g09 [Gracilaria domingensis]|nr:hypothetical protein FGB62_15g09 [Gracilaria domingensis]
MCAAGCRKVPQSRAEGVAEKDEHSWLRRQESSSNGRLKDSFGRIRIPEAKDSTWVSHSLGRPTCSRAKTLEACARSRNAQAPFDSKCDRHDPLVTSCSQSLSFVAVKVY